MSDRGTKYNKGKPRFSLVPVESLEEIMKVLEAGAVKYGEYNWTKGIPFTEVLDALHRHYLAYSKGIDLDPESGISHVAHMGANIMFLIWYEKFKPEFDNRFKNPTIKSG